MGVILCFYFFGTWARKCGRNLYIVSEVTGDDEGTRKLKIYFCFMCDHPSAISHRIGMNFTFCLAAQQHNIPSVRSVNSQLAVHRFICDRECKKLDCSFLSSPTSHSPSSRVYCITTSAPSQHLLNTFSAPSQHLLSTF